MRCTVCTLGFTLSATRQQVRKADFCSLKHLCGVLSVFRDLLSLQIDNRKADILLFTIETLRCIFCILGLTVCATDNRYGRLIPYHYINCSVYGLYCGE